jgi:hypothetical protein
MQHADAKIVYTPTHRVIGLGQHYNLDISQPKVTDFKLSNDAWCTSSQEYCAQQVSITGAPGNGGVGYVAGSGWEIESALKMGERIGNGCHFQSGGILLQGGWSGTDFGQWYEAGFRYIGLKFKIKGKTHYGWARLSVTGKYENITATLTGYAYETIPNKSIIAAKTKGPDDDGENDNPDASITNPAPDIPQPTTLGGLALGAPGLSIWRKDQ